MSGVSGRYCGGRALALALFSAACMDGPQGGVGRSSVALELPFSLPTDQILPTQEIGTLTGTLSAGLDGQASYTRALANGSAEDVARLAGQLTPAVIAAIVARRVGGLPPVRAAGPEVAAEGVVLESVAESAAPLVARYEPSRAGHIFRDAPGHVNPASAGSLARFARLFEHVASNPGNLRADGVTAGIITQDAANSGMQAFTWVARSGQVWVTVRNGLIQNAGVNPAGAFR